MKAMRVLSHASGWKHGDGTWAPRYATCSLEARGALDRDPSSRWAHPQHLDQRWVVPREVGAWKGALASRPCSLFIYPKWLQDHSLA